MCECKSMNITLYIYWVFQNFKKFHEFGSFVKWKYEMLKRYNSIILSLICHSLRNFPPIIHIPPHPFVIFETLQMIIFWVWVTHKGWTKFDSTIFSVTCHGLENFSLLIHIPSYPFVNFWNPMSYYFLSLSHS